jgi:selenide,water dikinase
MGPGDLDRVMSSISIPRDENVIVGPETSDDAGVYRLDAKRALVQTVDFITPVVDDPFTFGRIAAANSLSDVYAMGGKPITAMNIVCFPCGKFPLEVLEEILKGGLDRMKEAGVQLLGGHSVQDNELKYGLSVTGMADPARILRNIGMRDGDGIILTKAVGTGILATANKAEPLDGRILDPMIESMVSLNRQASEIMLGYDVHACTDVTGFGLVGHLREMIGQSGLEVVVDSKRVSVFAGALDFACSGMMPAGLHRNREFSRGICRVEDPVDTALVDIFHDPQTSGGLLIAVDKKDSERLLDELRVSGLKSSAIIGEVKKYKGPGITII